MVLVNCIRRIQRPRLEHGERFSDSGKVFLTKTQLRFCHVLQLSLIFISVSALLHTSALHGASAPSKKKQEQSQSFRQAAENELIKNINSSAEVTSLSTATVSLNISPTSQEPTPLYLQAGLWVQAYQPLGFIQPVGLPGYSLATISSYPIWSGRFAWTAWQGPAILGHPIVGPSTSIGLGTGAVRVRTPTDYDFGSTYLTHFDTQLGFASEWSLSANKKLWLGLQVGVGQVQLIQSSGSNLLNMSNTSGYAFGEGGLRWLIGAPLSIQIFYQWRQAQSTTISPNFHIDPTQQQFLLGISGEI
jgi:hypothetical protein